MSSMASFTRSIAIIGAGALVWTYAGRPLIANPDLIPPLNPLGINRSPYGEVFAMALQGPIDTFFDAGVSGIKPPPEDQAPPPATPAPSRPSFNNLLANLLTSLNEASEARTNPKPASEALKRHLRRVVENKLRFAYQLDPAHYGNYNSLHFFLTEPALGTHPEITPSAAILAENTILYCLKQDQDPRPALTAAAAASNILQLMFAQSHEETPEFSTAQMRHYLLVLDDCLARYARMAHAWDLSQQWDRLSPQRITECEMRFRFICKIRDAAEKTILRLEQKNLPPEASSNTPPQRGGNSDTYIANTHTILSSISSLLSPPSHWQIAS